MKPVRQSSSDIDALAVTTEPVYFPNLRGDRLAGRLDLPQKSEPVAYALIAHCFTCSKDIKCINWLGKFLAERGVAALRFDFTGLGDSEGRFSETTFSSNIEDILAAAEFLRSQYAAPAVLIGHSLGGTAVLAAGPRIPESRLVVTVAAAAEPRHIRERLIRQHPEILSEGAGDVNFGGRTVRIRREFLDDLDTHNIEQEVAALGRSLIVFHPSADEILDLEHGLRIFQAARPPKSFICLEDADHLLVRREADARYIAEVVAAWVYRHLAYSQHGPAAD
ncbi:MAG TPA: alpha/beta fold hydrolase [Phycisphaerae bacterium]|nr:alpha/beta fold hydrolase [Phycisphaerae bacterium]